jgi:Zn finger protein HypA/HybF involved in hydrogenase expression
MTSGFKLPRLKCSRCGHQWTPRQAKVYVCPKCHSPKWSEPPSKGTAAQK